MVVQFIIRLFKIFLYYLILFALCRLVFLLYFTQQVITEGKGIFFISLYKALPLDISTACYLCFIPLILLLFAYFFAVGFFNLILWFYLLTTSVVYILLAIAEIGVYREIHVKIYYNLLTHLQNPSELVRSSPLMLTFTLLSFIIFLVFFSLKLIQRLMPRKGPNQKINPFSAILILLTFFFLGALLVAGCRGGVQQTPINEGDVYFSGNQCVNDATVNSLWSLGESIVQNRAALKGITYYTMPDADAEKIVTHLFSVERDSTISILKSTRPNICFIILESWSADVIASLGGYENLSPNFEQLIRQGYLFTNIRAAGHMSDQGVPAILSAYPALTTGSVINQPERQVNLSGIVDQLKPLGYYSSFFYGGPLTFGNIKSYIYRNGYNRVMDKNDFPSSVPSGRLGIHDSIMLHIWLDSLSSAKQPFLSSLFTISTHAPFDEPFSKTINWGGMDNSYLNSVMYADQQLKIFFDQAKKQSWYANTLFILVADHSHGLPKHYAYDSYEYYHIPLLLYGGALKDEYRGIKDNRIGSQNDILATLLHQMNLPDTNYRWSKNLLNPFTQEFAFYTFDNGFGFADTTGVTVWNHKFPSESYSTGTDEAQKQLRLTKGHAMLQAIMKDYLSK